MQIAEGVWQVDGLRASNVYVIAGEDGAAVIDTGTPGSASTILQFMAQIGYGSHDVRTIMITHTHIDHIGSLPPLQQATGAAVCAPEGEAAVIEGQQPLPCPAGPQKLAFAVVNALLRPRPTVVTHRLRAGNAVPNLPGWRVVSTPGHTPDHISFYNSERELLIAGDALVNMNGLRRSPRMFTSNMALAQRSVALLAGFKLRTAAFGHGDPIVHDRNLAEQIANIARADRQSTRSAEIGM